MSRFITRQVTDMKWMFAECGVLKSLDVSHFATNQVKDMKCMFYKCDSLENLDVSHFVTDQVTDSVIHVYWLWQSEKSGCKPFCNQPGRGYAIYVWRV